MTGPGSASPPASSIFRLAARASSPLLARVARPRSRCSPSRSSSPTARLPRGAAAAGTDQPVNTASFMPFGRNYRGGVSLATGWLAGSLGGAKRIVVSQLADRGSVKIFSSGSALDGGPSLYLQSPMDHAHSTHFREIAGFEPFDGSVGTWVATTSTTTGANLLVSGVAAGGTDVSVLKYEFVRPNAAVDDTAGRAPRTSLVRKRITARHPWRRLEQIPIRLNSLHSPSPAGLTKSLTRGSSFFQKKWIAKSSRQ